jgi:hypothetical protein
MAHNEKTPLLVEGSTPNPATVASENINKSSTERALTRLRGLIEIPTGVPRGMVLSLISIPFVLTELIFADSISSENMKATLGMWEEIKKAFRVSYDGLIRVATGQPPN